MLEPEEPVTRIEACGMACTLIHREVLRAVEDANGDDPWTWFGHDLVNGLRLSEDYTFCRRARAAGITRSTGSTRPSDAPQRLLPI